MSTGGLVWCCHLPREGGVGLNGSWDNSSFASLRFRYLGSSPVIEDGSVRSGSSTLANAGVGHRWGHVEARLDVFNLFDAADTDISYLFASRLPGEAADGVEDVHAHPLEPRSVRGT